jgi:diguanylate cyclase (GGDEF)-like protein
MGNATAALRSIPQPPDEAERLAALHRLPLLDTPPDEDFDFLVELAARLCDAPHAFFSLVDADRVWIKASAGHYVPSATAREDSLCAWSILEDGGLSIPDLAADARSATLPTTLGPPRFRMYHGVNVTTAEGHRLGALCVLDTRPRTLDLDQRRVLSRLARQAMALVELRAQQRQLAHAHAQIETLASVDELTGLAHRRVLMERLGQEVERARRFGAPVSVVLIDLDQFKTVNDLYGLAVGDQVLRNVGMQLKSHLRSLDVAGRHAGEQLCLVLPGTPPGGGLEVANSLRETIAGYVHRCDRQILSVTASFGVSGLEPGATGSVSALLKAADAALQRAKEHGRNRVESQAPA